MQHNADLEAENAELRAELAAVAAAREAAEAALCRESSERAVAAKAAVAQQAWRIRRSRHRSPSCSGIIQYTLHISFCHANASPYS